MVSKKSGISVFLVSVENGAGVNKMTNMTYVSSLIEKLKIMMVVLRDSSILGSHHLGEFITAWADFDPSGT